MLKMIFGGIIIVGAFGLNFTDYSWTNMTSLIIGFIGAVLFFWGFVKVYKPRRKRKD